MPDLRVVHRVVLIVIGDDRARAACSGDHSFPGEVGDAVRDQNLGRGVLHGDGVFAAVIDRVPRVVDVDSVQLAASRILYVYSAAVPVADLDVLDPAVGAEQHFRPPLANARARCSPLRRSGETRLASVPLWLPMIR